MDTFLESIIPVIALFGFFGSIILWIYMFFSSRHKQRMTLIESGRDATIFRTSRDHRDNLKIGMVSVMVGAGLLLGYVMEKTGLPGFVAYLSMVLIFGGAGLVGFYFLFGQKMEETI